MVETAEDGLIHRLVGVATLTRLVVWRTRSAMDAERVCSPRRSRGRSLTELRCGGVGEWLAPSFAGDVKAAIGDGLVEAHFHPGSVRKYPVRGVALQLALTPVRLASLSTPRCPEDFERPHETSSHYCPRPPDEALTRMEVPHAEASGDAPFARGHPISSDQATLPRKKMSRIG